MKGIRGLVLAALAATALVAFPASASATGGIAAESYPATLHGVAEITFTVAGKKVFCSAPEKPLTFEATLSKPTALVTTTSVTNPTCEGGSLEMKGCQLELDPGSDAIGIGPAGCGPVKLFATSCPGGFSIPAQTAISTQYKNTGSGSEAHVEAAIEDSGVEYSVESNFCKKAGTYKDLQLSGSLNMIATNEAKSSIGVFSGKSTLYFAGGPEAGEPRLAADKYPVHVTGERYQVGELTGSITLFERGTIKGTCNVAQLDGGELAGPAYGEFTLNATYSGCHLGGASVTVKMNSCRYVYSGLEQHAAEEYASTAKIACNAGDAITLVGGGCTLKVPGQTLNQQTSWFNELFMVGWIPGYEDEITGIMLGTGVEYTASLGCQALGFGKELSGKNASVESDMLLHGA